MRIIEQRPKDRCDRIARQFPALCEIPISLGKNFAADKHRIRFSRLLIDKPLRGSGLIRAIVCQVADQDIRIDR